MSKLATPAPQIRFSANAGEVAALAAHDLATGLSVMLSVEVASSRDSSLSPAELLIDLAGGAAPSSQSEAAPAGDAFDVAKNSTSIAIRAGSERGLIHASTQMLEKLGAQFPPGVAPLYPRIDRASLDALTSFRSAPAFARRAFISDIMTWNYGIPDRLELHLRHDRDFIPWMARRGINTFSYIRHAHDTRLRIDQIAPTLRAHGIGVEYGGHVLQILLSRDLFATHPEYFPAGKEGTRAAHGNLCVSNPGALALVRAGALAYVREYPENELLHIWGADVRGGAWCRCADCRELPPQLQYMKVVNAIAAELATDSESPPIAYLAYHDTMEPRPDLKPLDNVWFEWAPRERCYSHAIDDPACEINPRYFDALKRHIDIFDGRGHIFEYYADAILFGGLGVATPAIVAADLRAYRRLGLNSISCLTFGAYSVMAYPANLEAFVRGAINPDFDPATSLKDTASGRHPRCAPEMGTAYRAVERASKLCLDYADVMHPVLSPEKAARKRNELREAASIFNEAIAAADSIESSASTALSQAEKELWRYSSDVLAGMADYLGALEQTGIHRQAWGAAAITRITEAIAHIRAIDPEIKGTWGAYDLEWMREMWLRGLQRRLDGDSKAAEGIF